MARFGLISDPNEPHISAIASELKAMGHEPFWIDSSFHGQFLYSDGIWTYEGKRLDDIQVFFFRNILTPLPPMKFENQEYKLYENWYEQYMHVREIYGVKLSWLCSLGASGKEVVNPITGAEIGVLKPHQLFLLTQAGFPLPKTLITGNPEKARGFIRLFPRVLFKPSMGGAYADLMDEDRMKRLEAIRRHYVIFQEYVEGDDIRVTATEDEILAVAKIESQTVDFRLTPGYMENKSPLSETEIPEEIAKLCLKGLRILGLRYSGIDLKKTKDGNYVFLEFNTHPAFLWIEKRLDKPISAGIARLLVKLHQEKKAPKEAL